MSLNPEYLTQIKTLPSLIRYLRDELDWPIEADDFEELTFDYEPKELGIDTKTAAKIEEIKQLRPLVTNQPWAIFFVKFEPKRLPVIALRRILSRLVIKKRASARKSDLASWSLNDLLFISNYGEGNQRHITFAHFSQDDQMGDLPTLKVLGWDDEDTVLHLEQAHKVLKEKLRWPSDPQKVDEWRDQWASVFTLRHKEVITTSKDLAIQLARLATAIRKRVSTVLSIESENGPLKKLMNAFKQALIHDLYEEAFADMYAQTITYGLLSARVSRPAGLVADNLTDMVPITNPFLKELLSTFLTLGGRKGKIDFDELGINEVVHALRNANMEAVLRDFGDRNPQEDPVIHFYELFLKEYNPDLRMKRGVFYTPRPVVSFIVRSVDEILRTEFGLEDGLADTVTWGGMLKRHPEMKLPKDTKPEEFFVQILDPALGTGTFLVEMIDIIRKTMTTKWQKAGESIRKQQQLWNEYVPRHLLPRVYGFELLMAPYAIAHMKIGLKLYETGYRFHSEERAHIYLTNSLEPAQDFSDQFEFMAPAIAHEAAAVNDIKRHKCFTVIVGNPPYSNISQNMGIWIKSLVEDYRLINGVKIVEKSKRNHLQDDYVKFFRVAHNFVSTSNYGVIGYITNHSFLDSPTFRGMRFCLMTNFNSIQVLNLHGNAKRNQEGIRAGDENVFDIQQGVAITFLNRALTHSSNHHCQCQYTDLYGSRGNKYQFLAQNNERVITTSLQPMPPFYFLVPSSKSKIKDEYESGWKIDEVMAFGGAGVKTNRDAFVIDFEDEPLKNRMGIFADESVNDHEVKKLLNLKENYVWKIPKARANFRRDSNVDRIRDIAYRPFDLRRIYYQKDVVFNPRFETMRQSSNDNLFLLTCRQQYSEGFRHVFVCRVMFECCVVSAKSREITSGFPLYLYPSEKEKQVILSKNYERTVNLSKGFISNLSHQLNLQFLSSGSGDLKQTYGPEDVFHYFYAALHSPSYRTRYFEFLKIDFPRLPLISNLELFRSLVDLGNELVCLHLMEASILDKNLTKFVGRGNNEAVKVRYEGETVWINANQGFCGVTEDVWNFHIGGYQVCEKWLKDRKGSRLTEDDITHYDKIVIAINGTIRLMTEIEKVIDAHGGWPNAFTTSKT